MKSIRRKQDNGRPWEHVASAIAHLSKAGSTQQLEARTIDTQGPHPLPPARLIANLRQVFAGET